LADSWFGLALGRNIVGVLNTGRLSGAWLAANVTMRVNLNVTVLGLGRTLGFIN